VKPAPFQKCLDMLARETNSFGDVVYYHGGRGVPVIHRCEGVELRLSVDTQITRMEDSLALQEVRRGASARLHVIFPGGQGGGMVTDLDQQYPFKGSAFIRMRERRRTYQISNLTIRFSNRHSAHNQLVALSTSKVRALEL